MRRVYGIGETICDIIFKENKPVAAKSGGSTFNAMVSLGRMGINPLFISKIGDDNIGQMIIDFMVENRVKTDSVVICEGHKTDIALAFLNDKGDAEYSFYKEYDRQFVEASVPDFKEDDILLLGSYFALNPLLRPLIKRVLNAAVEAKAIIYYDPNFRATHLPQLKQVQSSVFENIKMATIVRGSDEDFENIFGKEADFCEELTKLAPRVLITRNAAGVDVINNEERFHYSAQEITPLSTIGAGDSFNAGFIYALIRDQITYADIEHLELKDWERLVATSVDFSTEVCLSYENYVSLAFAEKHKD